MVYSRVSYKLFFLMRETGIWDMGGADRLIAEYSEAQSGCPISHTYTPDGVRALVESSGPFEVLRVEKAHIFPYSIPEYTRGELVRAPEWANVTDEQMAELEKELGWHTLVVARRR